MRNIYSYNAWLEQVNWEGASAKGRQICKSKETVDYYASFEQFKFYAELYNGYAVQEGDYYVAHFH